MKKASFTTLYSKAKRLVRMLKAIGGTVFHETKGGCKEDREQGRLKQSEKRNTLLRREVREQL
jgi:hypothetical protein